LRRFGLRAGAVAACLLGLSTMAGVNAAGAATTGTPSAATPTSPSAAPALSAPLKAPALNLPPDTTGCAAPKTRLQMQCQVIVNRAKRAAGQTVPTE